MNILVFAPHPDDDILGCGGSIAKYIKNNQYVTVVYMTSGDAGDMKYTKAEMAAIRKKEVEASTKILGVQETIFLDIPDGYVEYNNNTVNTLIKIVREKKPNIVYMPHAKDAHRDHVNTFILVNEAITRASANSYQEVIGEPWYVPNILCYEVWTPLQDVSYVEDISDFMETKLTALRKHSSQLANVKYDDAIQGLNQYRGAMTDKGKYCECFAVLRINKLSD